MLARTVACACAAALLAAGSAASVDPAGVRAKQTVRALAVLGSWGRVEGDIRAARMQELQRSLPSLTRGEGVLELSFDRYEPVTADPVPARSRTDDNPLNREEYLLRATRRGLGS